MDVIKDKTFDEERALYNIERTKVLNCNFAGKKDGESVLKETRDCMIEKCNFSLRYPLWHAQNFSLVESNLDELVRAPIWYANEGTILKTVIKGIKCLRECNDILIDKCVIDSKEFGWRCNDVTILSSVINSEYFLFETKNITINDTKMTGKYSFQYIENGEINNCEFDTKDAFWHTTNLKVTNSIIKGEYLGWFSKNLTLENCTIIGTQPFCYCDNLKLINCKMIDTDLAFEYSSVDATITGDVLSIKNPKSGTIVCDSVGEVIHDHTVMPCTGEVVIRK